ncbi:MAG: hypothetical protein HY075_11555 [Deltaproteobacteria bacterium]|nr:hypothetical protein [Deltaproteobacteria bacterium]
MVNCGTIREHVDSFEENDAVLVAADGYQPSEEKFIVKHPGWFQSCNPEQTIIFETVLNTITPEEKKNKELGKKSVVPKESPNLPWPNERSNKKGKKGAYSL